MRSNFCRTLLACACVTALTGCSIAQISASLKKGDNIDDVIADWGAPDSIYFVDELPIGQLGFSWQSHRQVEYQETIGTFSVPTGIGVSGMATGDIYQTRVGTATCTTELFVDENGIVVGTKTSGCGM